MNSYSYLSFVAPVAELHDFRDASLLCYDVRLHELLSRSQLGLLYAGHQRIRHRQKAAQEQARINLNF